MKTISSVEPSIRELVEELNRRGFRTFSSCEGHARTTGRLVPAYITFKPGVITSREDVDEVSEIVKEFTDTPFRVSVGRVSFYTPVSKRPIPSQAACYDIIMGVEGKSEAYSPETARKLLKRFNAEDIKRSAESYAAELEEMKTYYRVTFSENLPSILKRGLVPQERTGDSFYPERTVRRVYLQDEPDDTGFYGDVILKIRIPPGMKVTSTVFAEGFYTTKPIPPNYISVYRILR